MIFGLATSCKLWCFPLICHLQHWILSYSSPWFFFLGGVTVENYINMQISNIRYIASCRKHSGSAFIQFSKMDEVIWTYKTSHIWLRGFVLVGMNKVMQCIAHPPFHPSLIKITPSSTIQKLNKSKIISVLFRFKSHNTIH